MSRFITSMDGSFPGIPGVHPAGTIVERDDVSGEITVIGHQEQNPPAPQPEPALFTETLNVQDQISLSVSAPEPLTDPQPEPQPQPTPDLTPVDPFPTV